MFRSKNFLLTMHRLIKLKVTRNYAREYYTPQQIIQPELLFMNKTNSDILKLKKQIYNLEKARQALQEQISETTNLVRELSNILAASKEEEDTSRVLSQAASDIEEQSSLESNKYETALENESEYEQSKSVLHETPTVEHAEPIIDKPSGATLVSERKPKYKEPERVEQLSADAWYPYLKPDDVQPNAEHNITMKPKETPEFDRYNQHKAASIAFIAPSLDPIEPTSINADTHISNQHRPLTELYSQETVDYATDSENITKQGYLADQEALATSTMQLNYITEPEFNTWSDEQGYKSEPETMSIATEDFSERKGFQSEPDTKSIATEDLNETKGLESEPETMSIVTEGLNESKGYESKGFESEPETMSIVTEGLNESKGYESKGFESEPETMSIVTEGLNESKGFESEPETMSIVSEGLNESKGFESEPETKSIAPEDMKEIEQISPVEVQSDITWSEQEPHATQEDIVRKELEDISEINQIEIQRLEESIKKQPEAIKIVDMVETPTISDAMAESTPQEANFTMETQTLEENIPAQETAPTLHHEQDIISENQAETSATLMVTPVEGSFPKHSEISPSTDETNATLMVTPIEGSFPESTTNSEISPSAEETLMVTPIEGSFPESTTNSEISPSAEETLMVTPIEGSFPESTTNSEISPSAEETLMVTPIEGSFPESTTNSEISPSTEETLMVTPIEGSFPESTTNSEISPSAEETLMVTPIEGSFPESTTNSEISPSAEETLMVTPIEGSFPKSTTHSEISPSTEEMLMVTPIEGSFPKSTTHSEISPSTEETLMVTPIEGSFPKSTTYSEISPSTLAAEETESNQYTEESNIVPAEKESKVVIGQAEINFQQLQQETVASEKEKRTYQRRNKKGSSDSVDAGEFVDY